MILYESDVDHVIIATNPDRGHATFVDLERPREDLVRRIVLEPSERKKITLKAGIVYVTPAQGVVLEEVP